MKFQMATAPPADTFDFALGDNTVKIRLFPLHMLIHRPPSAVEG